MYLQQHPNVLLRAKGTAENALQNYSSEVIDIALEDKQREIDESIIVGEIRELRKFWPQFGINLAGGFVASILFAALLSIAAFLVLSDASPAQIGKQLRNNIEEMTDG